MINLLIPFLTLYLNVIAPPEPVIEQVQTFEAEITAYCPCADCCGVETGITKSGTVATEGRTIAADKRFDFGTEIEIDGVVYVVEDRGGAIRGNRIDMFFQSHEEALQWGRQKKTVIVR